MKKTTNIKQQLLDLKLKLIEVQNQVEAAPSKAVEDFKVLMGYVPQGHKTTDDLKTEVKTLKKQIAFLETEMLKVGGAGKNGTPAGGTAHEKVKAEFDRVRKEKKFLKAKKSIKF